MLRLPKKSRKKLSKNFTSWEFDCHCGKCTETYIDENLIKKLQEKRDKWGLPITVVSGYRCHSWNKKVGGVSNSQHVVGRAADIVVYGKTPKQVWKDCQDFQGLGLYERQGFCHCDVRHGKRARWTG